jgi:hypothetical protein
MAHVKFCHDASEGKNVDGRVVVGAFEEELGGAVPARRNIVCVGRSGADFSREAKICEFGLVAVDEDVFGLEVTVEEAMFMHISETLCALVDDGLDLFLGEGFALFFEFFVALEEVLGEILEDEVEFVFDFEDLFEEHDVGVGELDEGFYFTKISTFVPVTKFALHFLDGDDLGSLVIDGFVDYTEGAVTESPLNCVLIHLKTSSEK